MQVLARRLAAAGMGVEVSRRRDTCQLTIVGAASGKPFVALSASGQARWYYEPATGPCTNPAVVVAIILRHRCRLAMKTTGPSSHHTAAVRGLAEAAAGDCRRMAVPVTGNPAVPLQRLACLPLRSARGWVPRYSGTLIGTCCRKMFPNEASVGLRGHTSLM
jgi:hypothetical protein